MKKVGMMGAVLLSGAAFAADGLKVGGHVDAQWNWAKNASTNTFAINDGSVKIGKTMGGGEALVDLAFAGRSTTSTAFSFAQAKSQAWLSWKYDMGVRWKMGQFDSLFGREANDSNEITFAQAGSLKNAVPTTHVGLDIGYDFSDMLAFDFLIGNANTQGALPARSGNLDLGVKVGFKHDNFWGGIGGHFKRQLDTTVGSPTLGYATGSTGFLIDATFGMNWNPMTFGIEVLFRDGKYNNVTDSTAGTLVSGFGFGLEFGYKALENLNVAIRGEFLSKVGSSTGDGSRFEITVGPQWWASKDLVAKLDYTFSSTKLLATSTTSTTDHNINIAGVYTF